MEEWKTIRGFEDYMVSNTGMVKSLKKINKRKVVMQEKILKLHDNGSGYLFIRLHNKYESKTFRVHRLVAFNYVSNPQNKSDVNHKDCNKKNNNFENLEWCSKSENTMHGYLNNLIFTPNPCRKKIRCKETGIEYESISDCARKMILKNGAISKVCSKKMKKTGGYSFEFI